MYLSELRGNWRPLLAAALGLSIGHGSNIYITSIFSPHLIVAFGWSTPQFAMLGVTIVFAIAGMPIVGRLADIFGARRVAAVGLMGAPLCYVLFSLSWGPFWYFFVVAMLQTVFVGTTTTSTVYSRLVAERFAKARGLALSITAVSPPAVVAVLAPLLSGFVDRAGWRAGYLALAGVCALCGLAVFLLIPRKRQDVARGTEGSAREARKAYSRVLANASFRFILVGMMLCSVTLIAFGSQLKLILLDKGLTSDRATAMISLLALGTMTGRLASGLALDRFAVHLVAAIALGVPAAGLALLASPFQSPAAIALAVAFIGFANGAELDVAAYLIMRHFPIELYSTAFGVLSAGMAVAAAAGSLLLGLTLEATGSFDPFLLMSSALTLVGSGSFLLLERSAMRERRRIGDAG
jgi:MFS family permease